MPATRVLFFDGLQVRVLRWQRGHIETEERFPATPLGQEALVEHLRAHDDGPALFLADIAEEGFQFEHVPYLQGADRRALIARRLGQYYYGTPYATTLSQGRETTGRRDERVLFAALTRREMLAPWLDSLREARIALRGLYSVPLALAYARLPFASGAKRFLLVSIGAGGLRHTFFDDGQMRFSRLTQITTTRPDMLADTCHRETVRTVQYLLGQRQINRGTVLPVFVLAHTSHHAIFRERCEDLGDVAYQLVDLNECARALGCKSPLADSFADPLLAHLLVSATPRSDFAPEPDRHLYRLWQWRFGLRTAALVCLASGLVVATKLLLDANDIHADTLTRRASASADQGRYQAILGSLPPVAITPPNLRALLGRYDELLQQTPASRPALAHLGTTLLDFPGIELKRLRWAVADKAELDKVGAGKTAPGAAPAPVPLAGAAAAPAWTELEIEGTLPVALASDQRRQIELLDRLTAQLQRDGALARIVSNPVEILPDKALRSEERTDASNHGLKPFVVRLYLPNRPATP